MIIFGKAPGRSTFPPTNSLFLETAFVLEHLPELRCLCSMEFSLLLNETIVTIHVIKRNIMLHCIDSTFTDSHYLQNTFLLCFSPIPITFKIIQFIWDHSNVI